MERTPAGRAISLMHAAAIAADEADKAGDPRERVIAYVLTAQFWCEQALADLNVTEPSMIARRFAPKLASSQQP